MMCHTLAPSQHIPSRPIPFHSIPSHHVPSPRPIATQATPLSHAHRPLAAHHEQGNEYHTKCKMMIADAEASRELTKSFVQQAPCTRRIRCPSHQRFRASQSRAGSASSPSTCGPRESPPHCSASAPSSRRRWTASRRSSATRTGTSASRGSTSSSTAKSASTSRNVCH